MVITLKHTTNISAKYMTLGMKVYVLIGLLLMNKSTNACTMPNMFVIFVSLNYVVFILEISIVISVIHML